MQTGGNRSDGRSHLDLEQGEELLDRARELTRNQKVLQRVSAEAMYAVALLPVVFADGELPALVARRYCNCG